MHVHACGRTCARRTFFPNLPGLTSLDDVAWVMEDISESIDELDINHNKAFADLGGGSMPSTLGALWNEPAFNVTV